MAAWADISGLEQFCDASTRDWSESRPGPHTSASSDRTFCVLLHDACTHVLGPAFEWRSLNPPQLQASPRYSFPRKWPLTGLPASTLSPTAQRPHLGSPAQQPPVSTELVPIEMCVECVNPAPNFEDLV
jgi:hypothetical protein